MRFVPVFSSSMVDSMPSHPRDPGFVQRVISDNKLLEALEALESDRRLLKR